MGENQRVVGHCDGWAQRGESNPDVRVTPDLTGSVGFTSRPRVPIDVSDAMAEPVPVQVLSPSRPVMALAPRFR